MKIVSPCFLFSMFVLLKWGAGVVASPPLGENIMR